MQAQDIKPNIIGDWISALGTVANFLVKYPIYTLVLIGMSILDAIPSIPSLSLPELLILTYLSYPVIKFTWARINNLDEKKVFSELKGAEGRVFGVSIIYSLRCFLLGLLLIVPGIIFAIENSIALAVTCLEKRPIKASFNRSYELLKGMKWTAAKYMLLMPALIVIVLVGCEVLWSSYFEANKALPSVIDLKLVDRVAIFVLSIGTSMMQLSAASVMVRLYAYAKARQEKGAAVDCEDLDAKT